MEAVEDLFSKDGAAVMALEMLPFGGLVAAPFHLLAGNHEYAAAAVVGAALGAIAPGVGGMVLKGVANGAKALVAR